MSALVQPICRAAWPRSHHNWIQQIKIAVKTLGKGFSRCDLKEDSKWVQNFQDFSGVILDLKDRDNTNCSTG
jgi:hypothetical protein